MNNKLITGLLLLLIPMLGWAQKDVPEPTDFLVNDFAHMLSRQEVVMLSQKLRAYTNETSIQIVVVTETSLEGEHVFDYAHRLATTWGIGGEQNDNGILLFVAQSERKISIQTGYGTEGFLPDATAFNIIQNIMIPAFQEGNFYGGIDRAVDAIMDLGRGEYVNDGSDQGRRSANGFGAGIWIFLFIFGMILLLSILNRGSDDDDDGGYYRGGRYDDQHRRSRRYGRRGGGWIFFPGGGFGGGGGGGSDDGWGGFGGGGFGGFGGGDFGGGGAIGEW